VRLLCVLKGVDYLLSGCLLQLAVGAASWHFTFVHLITQKWAIDIFESKMGSLRLKCNCRNRSTLAVSIVAPFLTHSAIVSLFLCLHCSSYGPLEPLCFRLVWRRYSATCLPSASGLHHPVVWYKGWQSVCEIFVWIYVTSLKTVMLLLDSDQ